MIRYFITLVLISAIGGMCFADSGTSIDRMMQQELALSNAMLNEDEEGEEGEDFSFPMTEIPEESPYRKSASKAALFSLVLPGSGQYYVHGANFKSKIFFGLEASLWLSYLGFRKYGDYKEEAAKGFAVVHAGADANNPDEEYWVKMTYYDNRDRNEDDGQGYNQMVLVNERDRSYLFPETPNYYWNWDNRYSRQAYRNLRNESKTAYERSDITLGIVLANHVVSAIEAFFSANRFNRQIEFADSGFKLKYKLKPNPENPSLSVSLVKNF